jgi:hypothetical protein
MRNKIWWVALTVTVALALVSGGVAQPPGGGQDKFGGKKGKGGFGKGALTPEAIVDRIMSFDKNNSGKVTKDDLPERLQYLIEMGDKNKDGALDREEVKALADKLAQEGFPGGGGFGGKGGKGFKGDFGFKGGPGGPGGPVDQRLAELEERLETMLQEVKEIRGMLAKKGPKGPPPFKGPPPPDKD